MNLSEAAVVLRPRGSAEVFDLALRWTTGVGRGLYLRLGLLLALPAALGCFALRLFAEQEWTLIWVVAWLLAIPMHGVFTLAASRLMFERNVTAMGVLRQYASRLTSYLPGLFVVGFVNALGACILIAFPWTWARGAFVHEASLLEGHGAMAAVRRSKDFVDHQYSRVIGMLVGGLIAIFLVGAAADQAGAAVLEFGLQLGRPFGSLWEDGGSFGALLGFFGAIPYVASVRFLTYIDGRTRRDGWDIQLAFLALVMKESPDEEAAA